ncbi:MAG: twin-arginine translocase subunit TatC [Acidothermaceae bacterium]
MARLRRPADGRMSLGEHVRELRSRLLKSVLAIAVGSVVSFVYFNDIWRILRHPYCQVHQKHGLETVNGCGQLVFTSVFDPILWHFKVALIAGLLIGSPVWLYQLWAFVTPGLQRKERKYSMSFVAVAVPLFLAGATLAYFVMSKGLQLLLNFAPAGTTSLISIDHYLSYALAMLLMFGLAFDLPLLVVMLNFVGILSYARLKKSRRVSIFLVFVFTAIATPSGDPFTMLALGIPLIVLLEAATQIARVHDARKAKAEAASEFANLPDDEASPLDLTPRP